jgi:hypothetical protein
MIPPFVIFDAKQLNHLWTKGEVSGTRYGLSDSGWTDRGLFFGWLEEHFIVHAVPARPLLLLVDGHSSHYDPDSIRFARDHSVIIFCLPPHTTHEAQPLDVGFFGPLKKNWSRVCHDFIQSSPGKAITKYNFSELFSKAWLRTCTAEIICGGYKKAGIIPFDPESLIKRCPGSEGAVEIRRKECVPEANKQPPTEGITKNSLPYSAGSLEAAGSSTPLLFPPEKEELFEHRFEEGYDLYDDEYTSWLRIHHPDALPNQASVSEFFPDAQTLGSDVLNGTHHLDSSVSSGYQPSDSGSSPAPPSSSSSSSSSAHFSRSENDSSAINSSVLVPETPSATSTSPLFSSPSMSIPCTPVVNTSGISSSSSHTPPPKRSPLAPITNSLPGSTPRSSNAFSPGLARHIELIPAPQKETKTGKARVLTSVECIEMLTEKEQKKVQQAMEKEERKKERERKKLEREELARQKKETRLEQKEKREAATLKNPQETAARKLMRTAKGTCGKRNTTATTGRNTRQATTGHGTKATNECNASKFSFSACPVPNLVNLLFIH